MGFEGWEGLLGRYFFAPFATHNVKETSMIYAPVFTVVILVMGLLSFSENFWQFLKCVKRISIGVGGDQGDVIVSRFVPS